ncbi:MAG: TiaS agmantine-binding domain-containing protein [Thermoplasmata archaeon]
MTYIAVDDTDSPDNMCTTYVMSEIIKRSGYDVIGYPELVRLNPNISYKTRGNGALSVKLGKGSGKRRVIGTVDGRTIYGYEKSEEEILDENVIEIAGDAVEKFSDLSFYSTNPGIVMFPDKIRDGIYFKALEEDVTIEAADKEIAAGNGISKRFKNGHGVIGSVAAVAWPAERYTYEIITYRYPHPQFIDHSIKMEAARIADDNVTTFNNIDEANHYPAIFPHPKTPVIYGVRGFNPDELLKVSDRIETILPTGFERRIIFRTNQGTDDHIIPEPETVDDLHSYRLTGEIASDPYVGVGGHYFIRFKYRNRFLSIAAFEPLKEFRKVFSQLRKGDIVSFYGSFVNGNINVEKMEIHAVSRIFERVAPICEDCKIKTRNNGKNDFRCPSCGKKYRIPAYSEVRRNIKTGKYDVPVIARRHLSMPFEIERLFNDSVLFADRAL